MIPATSPAHAPCPPSSADRWVHCPLSVALEAQCPETDPDPSAAEGTASHWALAESNHGREVALGQVADNDVTLTEEMIEGALQAAEAFDLRRGSSAIEAHIEERVHISDVNWGTPDIWWAVDNPTAGTLTIDVHDYKYGHRYVEAWKNWQTVNYALGVLIKLGIPEAAYDRVHFNLGVFQPRNYHRDGPFRIWPVSALDLVPMFNTLRQQAAIAMQPNAPAQVGPWCQDCRGRFACESLARATAMIYDSATTSLPLVMPPAALSAELKRVRRNIEILKARESGLEQSAMHTIRTGARVPGFDLQPGGGREAWTKSDDYVINYGALLGVNVAKPPKALTPTQARKAGLDGDMLTRAGLTFRPKGALQLVEDDGRPIAAFGRQP